MGSRGAPHTTNRFAPLLAISPLGMSHPSLPPSYAIVPLGERALEVVLGSTVDRHTFHRVQAAVQQVEAAPPPGLVECVPTFTTLVIYYDPLVVAYHAFAEGVAKLLAGTARWPALPPRVVEIPVCYGGPFGEDLPVVAEHCGLAIEEVVALHTEPLYLVHMLGFVPGFPYLGGLSPRLAMPRRNSPRLKVAAGSVGIAGEQTGIYPFETPGGWQLIGRTPLPLFSPERNPPTLLQPGDLVRFRPITAEEYNALAEKLL